jgi:hypothetical protein
MVKGKNRSRKNPKLKNPQKVDGQQAAQRHFEIEKRLPIHALPVSYGADQPLGLSDFTYTVIDPVSGLLRPVHLSQELLSKLSAAHALLHFGFEYPLSPKRISSSWPHKWYYLTEEQLDELEALGLHTRSCKYLMTESLQIDSFGRYMYFQSDTQDFFDAWIEIIWCEYIIELELRRFLKLHKPGQIVLTSAKTNELNLHTAESWVPLEHSAVRIRAIAERLKTFILPLYFMGKRTREKADKKRWKELDTDVRGMLNSQQLPLYNLFCQFDEDMQRSTLKSLRDNLIHNLSHRPDGVISANNTNESLPSTLDGLYELIEEEHSRVREAMILMAAIIRAKTPANEILQENLKY